MRVFIGIRVTGAIKKNISSFVSEKLRKVREARFVAPENLHITLKFIGSCSVGDIDKIEGVLESIAERFNPFKAEIKGVGAFPDIKRMRVLWVGIDSKGRLKNLNRIIEDELSLIGFAPDARFKEHITVARFKGTPNVSLMQNLIDSSENLSFGEEGIKDMEIIRSVLQKDGPYYETLKKIQFGSKFRDT